MTFKSLLKRLQKRHYTSVRAFARALGIDESRISRGTPFDVRGCLHLAQITGEDPSLVLRAAGKGDLAAAIERLYGPAHPLLSAEQQALLTAFVLIQKPEDRQALITIARAAAGLTTNSAAGSGGATHGGRGGPAPMPPVGEPPQKMEDFLHNRARTAR